MSGKRDWLILSLKWSLGQEYFSWYQTNESGYTDDLLQAGRYTEQEAKDNEASSDGVTLAVRLDHAIQASSKRIKVEASHEKVKSFIERRPY